MGPRIERGTNITDLGEFLDKYLGPRPKQIREAIFRGSRELVTPFTGFILCDLYLSDEVRRERVHWLAPKSLPISRQVIRNMKTGSVIYCQVDQIEEFAAKYLNLARKPFILITGKWHLPGLQWSEAIPQILQSPYLVRWYSQNQIFKDLPICQFPYGVSLAAVPYLVEKTLREQCPARRNEPFVPFASVHEHLSPPVKKIRQELKPYMSKSLPLEDYFDQILSHTSVISPPGDRPDTYRHWECLALGATPILRNSDGLDFILSGAAVVTDDYLKLVDKPHKFLLEPSIPDVHLFKTWETIIKSHCISLARDT